jgi:hypothetical protein
MRKVNVMRKVMEFSTPRKLSRTQNSIFPRWDSADRSVQKYGPMTGLRNLNFRQFWVDQSQRPVPPTPRKICNLNFPLHSRFTGEAQSSELVMGPHCCGSALPIGIIRHPADQLCARRSAWHFNASIEHLCTLVQFCFPCFCNVTQCFRGFSILFPGSCHCSFAAALMYIQSPGQVSTVMQI